MKNLYSLLIWLCLSVSNAQLLKLPLNLRAEDKEFSQLMYVTNVFYFKDTNYIANPLDINIATNTDKTNWQKVKLPKIKTPHPTGYGYIFNGAVNNSFTGPFTLFYCTNPRYNFYPNYIYTDRNNNFDLTDDGPPDSSIMFNPVTIKLTTKPNGLTFVLQRPLTNATSLKMLQMNDEFVVTPVLGQRQFHGSDNSFYCKRLNILGASFNNGADSFLIGVKDVNCNSVYGEPNIDEVIVGPYNGILDNLNATKVDDNNKTYLERLTVAYTIKKIDPSGNFIEVLRDTTAKLKYSLNIGQKIPCIKFCEPVKTKMKKRSIKKYKGNYTYVYVWQTMATTFLKDSAALHTLGRLNKTNLTVLSLNHKGGGKYIKYYNSVYNTQLVSGYATNKVVKKLKIKEIPTGILIDKNQRIVAIGITPPQVLEFIKKQKNL